MKRIPPLAVAAGLMALVTIVYWRVGGHGFVDYDDNVYVFQNPMVQRGLTASGVAWAFTTFAAQNWHPLTWISHMADVQLFGLDPGRQHIVSVLWHGLNTLLLFALLGKATGASWRSAFVAALFAAHPLHVQSVAWIAERKDVISTFFWLVALGAYGWYAGRPRLGRYLCVALAFALGLMAKPMVVTLPLVLLLVDVWPLRRAVPGALSWSTVRPLVVEKIPLLFLSAASSVVTYVAQSSKATVSAESLPLMPRLANALLSYAIYLRNTAWPTSLGVFYPHPALEAGGIPERQVVASAAVLAAISSVAVVQWRRRPYVAVGWLWYLVTLVPVVGLVQVGYQAMADRYTYVPLIGIFVVFAWYAGELAERSRLLRHAIAVAAAILVLAAARSARLETAHWRDTLSLFSHATESRPDSWLAWKNLGAEQFVRGDLDAAARSFENALRTSPNDPDLWFNLGLVHGNAGRAAESRTCLERAVMLGPDDEEAWFSLGVAYAMERRPDRVVEVVARLRRMNAAKAQELVQRAEELQHQRR